MNDLSNFTLEELKEEIERREKLSKQRPPIKKPSDERLESMMVWLETSLIDAEREEWVDEDFGHYVFEEVMDAFYGPDFWEYYNSIKE